MQSSFHKGELIPRQDSKMDMSLRWRDDQNDSLTLSLAATIDSTQYMLCDYPETAYIYLFEAKDKYSALAASFSIARVNTYDWLAIHRCLVANSFSPFGLLSDSYAKFLEQVASWDDALVDNSAMSLLPWRTIQLIERFSDIQRIFLANYIKAEAPSMQSLKLFIEKMRDFAPFVNKPEYSKTAWLELTDKRSPQHIIADQLLQKLKYAKSTDSFESGQLQISFTAKSAAEYRDKLQKLLDESDTAAELFKIIGQP